MKYKTLIIFTLILFSSLYWGWKQVTASEKICQNPCNPACIAELFKITLLENQNISNIFLTNDPKNKFTLTDLKKHLNKGAPITSIPLSQTINDYVDQVKNKFISNNLKNYHKIQNQLFSNVIQQSLQNYEKISDEYQNQSVLNNNKQPQWNPALNDYYFIKLYKPKFESLQSLSITPVIPTFLVGLEASLNYALFSCNYQSNANNIVQKNSNIMPWNQIYEEQNKIEKEIFTAKKILDQALNSYDSLVISYPQHLAYKKLTNKLSQLRNYFKDLEEISANCTLSNRYHAACE